jgi:hypothetical protein
MPRCREFPKLPCVKCDKHYIFLTIEKFNEMQNQLKKAQEKIKQYEEMIDAIPCTCDIAYTSRKLTSPDCPRCNYIYDPEESK